MERLYRIEIDVLLDDRLRHRVIQAAREDYEKSEGYFTPEAGEDVRIPAEEFVVDTKTAFLEIAESGFRAVLPYMEPKALRCVSKRVLKSSLSCTSAGNHQNSGVFRDHLNRCGSCGSTLLKEWWNRGR